MLSPRSKYLPALILAGAAALCMAPSADGKRIRVTHDPAPADTMRIDNRTITVSDSISLAAQISLSGYDKTREANRESLFISNKGPYTLTSLTLLITYTATDGRLYHRRTETVKCHIPAGETRLIDFRSWDRQHSFYYHRSRKPTRTTATPYEVSIRPLKALYDP